MKKVDLNCDMGERSSVPNLVDEELLKTVSSANIACGFHAGNRLVMEYTVKLAKTNGVRIGAHPSYPDKEGFGRRNMILPEKDLYNIVTEQVYELYDICEKHGIKMQHVKPHGALYNTAVKDYELSAIIVQAVKKIDRSLIILSPFGSQLNKAAADAGLKTANEVFADRAYNEDGSLVSRSIPGAVIFDKAEAVSRVLKMLQKGSVNAITGKEIPVAADSICVHGDNAAALELTTALKAALTVNSIIVSPISDIE